MKQVLKIGITGGIGSGKTTCCQIFESLGIPVYYADERAKHLMYKDPKLKSGIKKIFGKEAYFRNGRINRPFIASRAFSNPDLLNKLNALVHPAVRLDSQKWFNMLTSTPFAIKEAALLIESGSYKELDKLIVVIAPVELRIKRVMKRDNTPRDSVVSRLKNQASDETRLKLADFVIYNDGQNTLISQVVMIYKILSNSSKR